MTEEEDKKPRKPCAQCPWRLENQGRPHESGFYTKKNLVRLWNQVRGGGNQQSCHLTDPSHPDHIKAGAKPGAKVQECPGSVILILRELRKMANPKGRIEDPTMYLATRKKGLTRKGILYWTMARLTLGHTPLGDGVLPLVDEHDQTIGLPEDLRDT